MLEQMAQTARMIQDLQELGIIGVYDGFHRGIVQFQVSFEVFKNGLPHSYLRKRDSKNMPYELVLKQDHYEIIAVLDMAEYEDFKTWEVIEWI